jgi:hypothetical protein
MTYFQTNIPYLDIFWWVLQCKMLVYPKIPIRVCTFGLFYSFLVSFEALWYILCLFGMLNQEKSGNPGWRADKK